MAEPILMPKQGQSVESCIITEWYKAKGDKISKGDLLFAYETDKASFDEEAKADGVLLDIFFEQGEEVPVLVNVGVIGTAGEETEKFKPGNSEEKSTAKETTETPAQSSSKTSSSTQAEPVLMPKQGQSVESCIITEWYKSKGDKVSKGDLLFAYETDKASFDEEAKTDGILLDIFFEQGEEVPVLVNVGVIGAEGDETEIFRPGNSAEEDSPKGNQETEKQPAQEATEGKTQTSVAETSGKIKVSPRAKRMAQDKSIPLNLLSGTGPQGRIIVRDVEKALKQGLKETPAAPKAGVQEKLTSPARDTGVAGSLNYADMKAPDNLTYGVDYKEEKLSNIRKLIASSMYNSLQNSAQLTHHLSADARNILLLRKKVKAMQKEGFAHNITLNDMICYATIRALVKNPDANVHFLGDSIRKFSKVHLGLAVDTERGLMVPALRNADDLSLTGLSSQLKTMAESCRSGNVDPDILASTAGSFTVSNLGNYGVEMFTPIINIPQAAILGVNTIINRPTQLNDGNFGFVPYIGLSLTYDHRALDGGPATKFLADIKNEIETFNLNIL